MSDLERLLLRAICDPGSFLERGDDYTESIPHWGMRAVLAALDGAGLAIVDKTHLDDLTGQVAGRDETIQRVRDYADNLVSSGVISYAGFGRALLIRIDGDPADDGSQSDG